MYQATGISSEWCGCTVTHLASPVSLQGAILANTENGFWMQSGASQDNAAHEQHRDTVTTWAEPKQSP